MKILDFNIIPELVSPFATAFVATGRKVIAEQVQEFTKVFHNVVLVYPGDMAIKDRRIKIVQRALSPAFFMAKPLLKTPDGHLTICDHVIGSETVGGTNTLPITSIALYGHPECLILDVLGEEYKIMKSPPRVRQISVQNYGPITSYTKAGWDFRVKKMNESGFDIAEEAISEQSSNHLFVLR